jgi:molecular chaperone DnaK
VAKRALSEVPQAVIWAPQIARVVRGPIDLRVEIHRARFEALCADLVARSMAIVEQALHGLGLGPEHVGQVVLTGGVTRIPMVRAAVARYFGREVRDHVNPDEAVALGAAVQAALCRKQRSALVAGGSLRR